MVSVARGVGKVPDLRTSLTSEAAAATAIIALDEEGSRRGQERERRGIENLKMISRPANPRSSGEVRMK
jgi:hypothetical protein